MSGPPAAYAWTSRPRISVSSWEKFGRLTLLLLRLLSMTAKWRNLQCTLPRDAFKEEERSSFDWWRSESAVLIPLHAFLSSSFLTHTFSPPSFLLAPVGGTGGVPAPGSAGLRRARNLQNAPGHTPLVRRTCAAPRLRPVYETRAQCVSFVEVYLVLLIWRRLHISKWRIP